MRVFYDRLIDDNDRYWLFNKIRVCVNTNFQEMFDVVFNNLSDLSVRNRKYLLCRETNCNNFLFLANCLPRYVKSFIY